jgi:hypothetical protein
MPPLKRHHLRLQAGNQSCGVPPTQGIDAIDTVLGSGLLEALCRIVLGPTGKKQRRVQTAKTHLFHCMSGAE